MDKFSPFTSKEFSVAFSKYNEITQQWNISEATPSRPPGVRCGPGRRLLQRNGPITGHRTHLQRAKPLGKEPEPRRCSRPGPRERWSSLIKADGGGVQMAPFIIVTSLKTGANEPGSDPSQTPPPWRTLGICRSP